MKRVLWNRMLAILLIKCKKKKRICKIVLLRRKDKWNGFSENVGDRICGKTQKIFSNWVAQGNTLYKMKSCLEKAGKICRGHKAMERREEERRLLCVVEAQHGAAKVTLKKVIQGEVHLYAFFLLCISLRQERSFSSCSSEVLADLSECFGIIAAYGACTFHSL